MFPSQPISIFVIALKSPRGMDQNLNTENDNIWVDKLLSFL